MIKLGMIGSDNSHADAFSQLCNLKQGYSGLKTKGARVVAIYGHDPKRTEEVARNGHIPTIVEKAEHMLGMVDAVIVTFRHGDLHAKYALPFLEARVPAFVDKPFAIKRADAEAMLAVARKRKTPLTSFSTLRFARSTRAFLKEMSDAGGFVTGSIAGPTDLKSEYGGLPFYGCHVTELLAEIFGYGVKAVRAIEHRGTVHATVRFGDERLVNLQFIGNAKVHFRVAANGRKAAGEYIVDTAGCYKDGLDIVLEMFRSRKRPLTDEQLLETVRVTDAVVRSYKKGGAEVNV